LQQEDEHKNRDREQEGGYMSLQDMARQDDHDSENILRMPSDYK
jgi:hypothetical protein